MTPEKLEVTYNTRSSLVARVLIDPHELVTLLKLLESMSPNQPQYAVVEVKLIQAS